MRAFFSSSFAAILLLIGLLHQAQVTPTLADTTKKYSNLGGVPAPGKTTFFKSKLFKAVAIPAAPVTYGALTAQGDAGLNRDARTFVQKQFRPVSTWLDNFLIIKT